LQVGGAAVCTSIAAYMAHPELADPVHLGATWFAALSCMHASLLCGGLLVAALHAVTCPSCHGHITRFVLVVSLQDARSYNLENFYSWCPC